MRTCLGAFILLLCSYNAGTSQTTIGPGEVTGTWDKSGSPYRIGGEINIPKGQRLTVEAGVRVEFTGHYRFRVYGSLYALGVNSDTIFFTSRDKLKRWGGIQFYGESTSKDTSVLNYCVIEYGHASSGLLLKSYSNDDLGGGIFAERGPLYIDHCVIRYNRAYAGGGIICGANTVLKNSSITDNHADATGIVTGDLNARIIGCLICNNTAENNIIGLYNNVLFLNNTVCNNTVLDGLWPLMDLMNEPQIINCIFYHNKPGQIAISDPENPSFINCDIEGGINAITDYIWLIFRMSIC